MEAATNVRATGNATMVLSPQWRRALEILADAGEIGIARTTLTADFSDEMVASLVLAGVAALVPDRAQSRLRITDSGRRRLDGDANAESGGCRRHAGDRRRGPKSIFTA
jgi:hypothetical protein